VQPLALSDLPCSGCRKANFGIGNVSDKAEASIDELISSSRDKKNFSRFPAVWDAKQLCDRTR
jgi:hypothetical protein